jgi:hypothetical protein
MGRANGMYDGQMPGIIKRLKWCQRRVEGEETIEINGALRVVALRLRDGNLRAGAVVVGVAKGDDYGEAIGRPTLENGDDDRAILAHLPRRLGQRRTPQK